MDYLEPSSIISRIAPQHSCMELYVKHIPKWQPEHMVVRDGTSRGSLQNHLCRYRRIAGSRAAVSPIDDDTRFVGLRVPLIYNQWTRSRS